MIKRDELNKMVVMTLNTMNCEVRASILYDSIKQGDPKILRREQIMGYRSFCKIINTFDGIESTPNKPKFYWIEK